MTRNLIDRPAAYRITDRSAGIGRESARSPIIVTIRRNGMACDTENRNNGTIPFIGSQTQSDVLQEEVEERENGWAARKNKTHFILHLLRLCVGRGGALGTIEFFTENGNKRAFVFKLNCKMAMNVACLLFFHKLSTAIGDTRSVMMNIDIFISSPYSDSST